MTNLDWNAGYRYQVVNCTTRMATYHQTESEAEGMTDDSKVSKIRTVDSILYTYYYDLFIKC